MEQLQFEVQGQNMTFLWSLWVPMYESLGRHFFIKVFKTSYNNDISKFQKKKFYMWNFMKVQSWKKFVLGPAVFFVLGPAVFFGHWNFSKNFGHRKVTFQCKKWLFNTKSDFFNVKVTFQYKIESHCYLHRVSHIKV